MNTKVGFHVQLGIEDGDAIYNTLAQVLALVPTATLTWTRIWAKTVAAQTALRWGYGKAGSGTNQGFMWFACIDITTAFQVGKIRLACENNPGTKKFVAAEKMDANLHTATNTTLLTATPVGLDLTANPLPEQNMPLVLQDSRLYVEYLTLTNVAGRDSVGFSIAATQYQ
jgi:hypothetical protein